MGLQPPLTTHVRLQLQAGGWAEPEPPVVGSAHPAAPSSPEQELLGPEQPSINLFGVSF